MTNLTAKSVSLTAAESALAVTIGILAPADPSYPSSAIMVTLPFTSNDRLAETQKLINVST